MFSREGFSQRREENQRLSGPNGPAQAPPALAAFSPADPPSSSLTTVVHVTPEPEDVLVPRRAYERRTEWVVETRKSGLVSILVRFYFAMMLIGALAALAYYKPVLPLLPDYVTASKPAKPAVAQSASDVSPQSAVAASSAAPPFPLPVDYGVYAIVNDALSELHALAERVPDKRISVSTPVNQPSRTTLPDGKAKFVLFRRDLVGNAPDRVDVRVVARVVRALTFDAKGKPKNVPVSGAWNMRNMAYEFRVRPVAGNPEMLLVQPDKPDFELPAGRYVLALKEQGYDFTVAGKVTEIAQCLERTEAANGTFYSECQKP